MDNSHYQLQANPYFDNSQQIMTRIEKPIIQVGQWNQFTENSSNDIDQSIEQKHIAIRVRPRGGVGLNFKRKIVPFNRQEDSGCRESVPHQLPSLQIVKNAQQNQQMISRQASQQDLVASRNIGKSVPDLTPIKNSHGQPKQNFFAFNRRSQNRKVSPNEQQPSIVQNLLIIDHPTPVPPAIMLEPSNNVTPSRSQAIQNLRRQLQEKLHPIDNHESRYKQLTSRQQGGKLQARSYNQKQTLANPTTIREQQKPDMDMKDFSAYGLDQVVKNKLGTSTDRSVEEVDKTQRTEVMKRRNSGLSVYNNNHESGSVNTLNLLSENNITIEEQQTTLKLIPCETTSSYGKGFKEKKTATGELKQRKNRQYQQQAKLRLIIQQNTLGKQLQLPAISTAYQDGGSATECSEQQSSIIKRDSSIQDLTAALFSPLTRNRLLAAGMGGGGTDRKENTLDLSKRRGYTNLTEELNNKKSYHEAFSQNHQLAILQSILKLQIGQIKRPKPPQTGGL